MVEKADGETEFTEFDPSPASLRQDNPPIASPVSVDSGLSAPREVVSQGFSSSQVHQRMNLHEENWPTKFSEHFQELRRQNRSEMAIEIEPQHLGKMVLRVETDHHQVNAWISAEHDQVKEILAQNLHLLRNALAEQGLMLGQFSVDIREDKNNRLFGDPQQGGRKKERSVKGIEKGGAGSSKPGTVFERSQTTNSSINLIA